MYLIGYDIGSSSIKAALVEAQSGRVLGLAQSPATEMAIAAPQPGWAEQQPEDWWQQACQATRQLLQQFQIEPAAVKGIGIAYQMHGLVLVDKNREVLRPSIIWCDSRAVAIGQQAFDTLGHERCLSRLLNSPGNFTASKLKWVQENEPRVYEQIHYAMLPGDYIAMKLTGEICTTPSGLSEGILWDFQEEGLARWLLEHYQIDPSLFPPPLPSFSSQGQLTAAAAQATGLKAGIPITYRAGDQPNNALSLNVLQPGEAAATGGTSGVIYGVVDQPVYDPQSRVNSFAHVNHRAGQPRIGVLLCINGAGSAYRWARHQIAEADTSYTAMEQAAAAIPIGAEGLQLQPFGNGAERMLGNRQPGAQVRNLDFNRHTRAHCYRAALEGIAFAFAYGFGILQEMGLRLDLIRVGNDNLFQSEIFSATTAALLGSQIEVRDTTGAVGAAQAAGVAAGIFASPEDALRRQAVIKVYEPPANRQEYAKAYAEWQKGVESQLEQA